MAREKRISYFAGVKPRSLADKMRPTSLAGKLTQSLTALMAFENGLRKSKAFSGSETNKALSASITSPNGLKTNGQNANIGEKPTASEAEFEELLNAPFTARELFWSAGQTHS